MPFIDSTALGRSNAAQKLIESKVCSRIAAQDASVFDYSAEIAKYAAERLGWTKLASKPPCDPAEIAVIASQARGEHLEAVVLIGQGGSTQAAQTITKLRSLEITDEVPFRTMDSLSPVYVNHILGRSNPARTLYIVASKSGTTLEPTMLSNVTWKYVCAHLGHENASSRFVAITDPETQLERIARTNNWRTIFLGDPRIGGRYSALSVFGLFPMACVGINVEHMLKSACAVEELCGQDSRDNPALCLASFLYTNWKYGRDKFSLLMPASKQVFGLWVEQLIAESLGKSGRGILPNVEVDAGILSDLYADRCAIVCNMANNQSFEHSKACLHPDLPAFRMDITDSSDMAAYFLIWEYATTFCGWLMRLNPFDQPDVEISKTITAKLLKEHKRNRAIPKDKSGHASYKKFSINEKYADKLYVSRALLDATGTGGAKNAQDEDMATLDYMLRGLFGSIKQGDYFSLNAFLPFRGIGRRATLERIRHRVADRLGTCSCLEIGPRYLHSTGQLHKGGPNTGVFLIVSSVEPYDIAVPHKDFTLGDVENAAALGDFSALAACGRRAIYIHLLDNDSKYLNELADAACDAISAAYAKRIRHKLC